MTAIDAAVAMNQADVTKRTESALTKGAYLALNVAADLLKLSGVKTAAIRALDTIGTKVRGGLGKLFDQTTLMNLKTVNGVYRPNMFGRPKEFTFPGKDGKPINHKLWVEIDSRGEVDVGTASVLALWERQAIEDNRKAIKTKYVELQGILGGRRPDKVAQAKAKVIEIRREVTFLLMKVQNQDASLRGVKVRLTNAGNTDIVIQQLKARGITDGIFLFDFLGFDTNSITGGGAGKLLPRELEVGTYKSFNNLPRGDNLTPHHMPSGNYITTKGIAAYNDGITIMMYHPYPAVAGAVGRHERTRTYQNKAKDPALMLETPKQSLEADIQDVRAIYTADGLGGPLLEAQLQKVIDQNKAAHPGVFDK